MFGAPGGTRTPDTQIRSLGQAILWHYGPSSHVTDCAGNAQCYGLGAIALYAPLLRKGVATRHLLWNTVRHVRGVDAGTFAA